MIFLLQLCCVSLKCSNIISDIQLVIKYRDITKDNIEFDRDGNALSAPHCFAAIPVGDAVFNRIMLIISVLNLYVNIPVAPAATELFSVFSALSVRFNHIYSPSRVLCGL